ncbi:hypothetical protein I4F81_000878 [Pyropia yezoensis]|uniref:Uncharacterized protein n=1 Tax=Pyropia yezoensis TaxID=2788 RepID=A0ACC3BKX1_PYRYE|nr:hypothetical protein I4F81_000878 [Neopyropia yezoensis]
MRADTRDRILKMLGDAQSYASEARMDMASPRAATGTPDTGCDDSDVTIVDAVVTGTTRTADGDHDRPSKRVRTSADKVSADAATRSGSARYKSDEEEEEEEGDMD